MAPAPTILMARVALIRHAESEANAGAPTSDPASIRLTECGAKQATNIAATFRAPPSRIVTSPYLRTQQTAAATCEAFPDTPREEWSVQEFTYLAPASCRNTTMTERRPLVDAFWARCDPAYVDGEGAESFADLLKRVHAMLTRIRDRDGGAEGELAIFTHGQFIQAVLWTALTGPAEPTAASMRAYRDFCTAVPIPNAAIVPLYLAGAEVLLGRLSLAHLDVGRGAPAAG